MEKRLLLAIVLSFLVLITWNIINPPPQRVINPPASSETAEKTASLPSESLITTPSNISIDNPKNTAEESIDLIESPSLKLEMSNLGGVIKKITVVKYNEIIHVSRILDIIGFENKEFKLEKMSNQEFIYSYGDKQFQIERQYAFSDDYYLKNTIRIRNVTSNPQTISVKLKGYELDFTHDKSAHSPDYNLFEYAAYVNSEIIRKANAFKFNENERRDISGKVNWLAFRNRYFSMIVKPQFDTTSATVNPINDKKLQLDFSTTNISLNPGESIELPSLIYAGPEDLNTLKKFNLEFEKVKKFYRFELFDAIAKIIYEMLHFTYKIVKNWGLCIIIISTIIYFSVYPLTLRGMASMKKIQALQPKIAALKERYKDNPQRLNKEMMDIYKENKINPLGGCLPFLLQMPVFIGLYQVLWRDVAFKGADFLWIKDLAEPDKMFILPFTIPFMGNAINFLPFLMMGIMFVQTRLQAKSMVITDEAQAMQQKMMTTMMPLMMFFIFYNFASGLTLYFTMFYMFSTLTQWKVSLTPAKV